jgi:hypothetical protein
MKMAPRHKLLGIFIVPPKLEIVMGFQSCGLSRAAAGKLNYPDKHIRILPKLKFPVLVDQEIKVTSEGHL